MTYRARHRLATSTGQAQDAAADESRQEAANPERRNPRGALILAVGGSAFALALARLGLHLASASFLPRMYDLGIYRDGGLIVRHAYHFRSGHPTPLYDWVSPGGGNPFTYPPFAAGLFAVLSYLPLLTLQWGMTAASLVALIVAIWLTLAATGVEHGRTRVGVALGVSALALWTQPVQSNLGLGQVNLLLMVSIIWDLGPAVRRAGSSRWWTGAATGVAAGIKLTPLIFILYLIVTRRFRQATMAVGAFAATIAVGLAAMPGASRSYWSTALLERANGTPKANVEFFFASAWNQSIRGVLSRLMLHAQLAAGPWLIIAILTTFVGLLCATWLHNDGYPMLGLLTCALTGLLISPISWLHHWVWVGPWLAALTAMAIRPREARSPGWAWLSAAGLVALTFVDWPLVPFLPGVKHGLDVVTAVPMKQPFSWHGIQLVDGNIFTIVGVAGLLALLGWGLARAYQPARAARLSAAATEHPTFQRGEPAPEVMTYRGLRPTVTSSRGRPLLR